MSASPKESQLSSVAQPGYTHAASGAKWQDFLFHKITLAFAALVLLVLAGILLSLIVGAWPALEHFGPGFITRIEWDPVTMNMAL